MKPRKQIVAKSREKGWFHIMENSCLIVLDVQEKVVLSAKDGGFKRPYVYEPAKPLGQCKTGGLEV